MGQIERAQVPNPQILTLSRLDAALGWEPGTARRIFRGEDVRDVTHLYPAAHPDAPDSTSAVLRAIEGDVLLSAEAKAQLAQHYGLLLRVAEPAPAVEPAEPMRPAARSVRTGGRHGVPDADPALEQEILADVERAARTNPKGPRRKR